MLAGARPAQMVIGEDGTRDGIQSPGAFVPTPRTIQAVPRA